MGSSRRTSFCKQLACLPGKKEKCLFQLYLEAVSLTASRKAQRAEEQQGASKAAGWATSSVSKAALLLSLQVAVAISLQCLYSLISLHNAVY